MENERLDIDFEFIKSRLTMFHFNARKDLPFMMKSYHFKRFGFKNKKDCTLLCKKTKLLMQKYPKKGKKNKHKNKDQPLGFEFPDSQMEGIEGNVQDTS